MPRAIKTLSKMLDAESEPTRVRAAIEILDRTGLKVAEELVLIPQETTNASLDAAIANALHQRSLLQEPIDVESDDVTDVTVLA